MGENRRVGKGIRPASDTNALSTSQIDSAGNQVPTRFGAPFSGQRGGIRDNRATEPNERARGNLAARERPGRHFLSLLVRLLVKARRSPLFAHGPGRPWITPQCRHAAIAIHKLSTGGGTAYAHLYPQGSDSVRKLSTAPAGRQQVGMSRPKDQRDTRRATAPAIYSAGSSSHLTSS